MNKFTRRDDGTFLTPEFCVSFPYVLVPDKFGKYGMAMLFDKKTTDMSVLTKAIEDEVALCFPKGAPRGLMLPIHDGDDSHRSEHEGMWYINGKGGKYKPGLVDAKRNPIVDIEDFYAGCYARAIIHIYDWDDREHGKKGISIGISSVQKIRDGEPLVSRVKAEDAFDEVVDVSGAEDL